MTQTEGIDHRIEGVAVEWQSLGVALLESNARIPLSCEAHLSGREVEPDRCRSEASGCSGDITGACRNVEDRLSAAQLGIAEKCLDRLSRHGGQMPVVLGSGRFVFPSGTLEVAERLVRGHGCSPLEGGSGVIARG